MSVSIAVRDRKGRDVATGFLSDTDFRVETSNGIRIVASDIALIATAKGRGPFTWRIGDVHGTVSANTAVIRKGDIVRITPTISVSAVKA